MEFPWWRPPLWPARCIDLWRSINRSLKTSIGRSRRFWLMSGVLINGAPGAGINRGNRYSLTASPRARLTSRLSSRSVSLAASALKGDCQSLRLAFSRMERRRRERLMRGIEGVTSLHFGSEPVKGGHLDFLSAPFG